MAGGNWVFVLSKNYSFGCAPTHVGFSMVKMVHFAPAMDGLSATAAAAGPGGIGLLPNHTAYSSMASSKNVYKSFENVCPVYTGWDVYIPQNIV